MKFKIQFTYIKIITLISVLIFIIILFLFRAYELSQSNWSIQQKKYIFNRGNILDSKDNLLVTSIPSISIGIQIKKVKNIYNTLNILNNIPQNILQNNIKDIEIKIRNSFNKNFIWVVRKVLLPEEIQKKLKQDPAIILKKEILRVYPHNKFMAHTLGFVGIDNEGLAGLEFSYHDLLSSNPDTKKYYGYNLHLTINFLMQQNLERSIQQVMEKTNADSGLAILSEVNTGKILALTLLPSFEPASINNYSQNILKNKIITDIYEPGSTLKVITLAILEEYFNQESLGSKKYECNGKIKIKGFTIKCHDSHGKVSLEDIIKYSCNSGIIQAGWPIPDDKYYKYLKNFGFGNFTGINLPGETKGILHPPKNWDHALKMSLFIGHGIGTTPIQLVSAFNSIANGGLLLQPYLLEKVTNILGEPVQYIKPIRKHRVIQTKTANKVLNYLSHTLDKDATGWLANLGDQYNSAGGKTGTSKVSTSEGYVNKYNASFIGFYPIENPEISLFILIHNPKNNYYGGLAAAPVFKEVVQKIAPFLNKEKFSYQSIAINNNKKSQQAYTQNKMPNFIGKSKKAVLQILSKYYPGPHQLEGAGYVVYQTPTANVRIQKPYAFSIQFDF